MQMALLKYVPEMSYAGNEAINTLYTNLTFLGEDKKKIMLTSSHANEGKSFLSFSVARTMAAMGKKVALVDADLRKSHMVRDFLNLGDDEPKGITHYLAGMCSLNDAFYEADRAGLYVVPCTKTVTNSLPLVSSERMKIMLDYLTDQMDYVIVDSPPVGVLVDAAKIATYCDGVVMVVGYGSVRRQELADAVQQLEQSGCPLLGSVINQAVFDDYASRKYYGGYYNKYYAGYYEEK